MVRRVPLRAEVLRRVLLAAAALATVHGAPAAAQDLNVVFPIAEIEARLRDQPFRIMEWKGSRMPNDRTQRALLVYEDSVVLIAKWATAPPNGARFNNEPRLELAAYEIQKLFLDEPDYVVPPTVIRSIPLAFVKEQMPDVRPTFGNAQGSVLVALQYWLSAVTSRDFWDPQRARNDTMYARYIGNFNIFTYIIRHSDTNAGNYLISTAPENPRVFSVDNGIAFGGLESDRGFEWRELVVERLPRRTIERLKTITREQLEQKLGVLAEFEVRDGVLVPVAPGENLSRNRGVRRSGNRIQLGLTALEIQGVEHRIKDLVGMANGRYKVF